MTEYTTILGDTWDGISLRVYGDERYMDRLIDANPEYRYTVIFSAGVVLRVPEIERPRRTSSPPWRRQ